MTAMFAETSVVAWDGSGGSEDAFSCGWKNGHDQRFHGRVVRGILACNDVWRVDRIRRKENSGAKETGAPRRPADLD